MSMSGCLQPPASEANDRNKNRFNRLADGFGAALGKHAEWRKPALAKTLPTQQTQVSELGPRESLLTPSTTRHRSQSAASHSSVKSTASPTGTPESRTLAEVEARYREESEMVKQAQAAIMDRPNFAIDAIGDSDDEGDEGEEGGDVMDEVEAFLKAHGDDDGGLKGEQKKVAEGEFGEGISIQDV